MLKLFQTITAVSAMVLMTACGGGGGGGDSSSDSGGSSSGGVCSGSGSTYICQGRICTKYGTGVMCPDNQYCPIPQNLSVTSNPVCASQK